MRIKHLQALPSIEVPETPETDLDLDPQVRTLCLVDIENMTCGSELRHAEVARLQRRIEMTAALNESAQTVIACGPSRAEVVWLGWKGSAKRLLGEGINGADIALLETVEDIHWVANRFERVVIASGDHIFASTVAALKALGVKVLVIAPPTGLSKQMRLAAGPDLKGLMFSTAHEMNVMVAQRKEAA
ncbi:NYN domain-containing protein [Micrococcoides hystricis]|uniref:NYN domain-containing protein n=1 Tax=Micrococcoides hystricis TaxID=1572761 RepID=A0ABV6PCC1_9MICC